MSRGRSEREILRAHISDASLRQKILTLRRDSFPSFFNRFLAFAVLLLSAELIRTDFTHDLPHIGMAGAVLLLFVVRVVFPIRYDSPISALQRSPAKWSQQLSESVKGQVQFISNFQKETTTAKHQLEQPTYSPLCTLWDKFTHSYHYNPRALICPTCGAHNGLHDPEHPPVYFCPHCGVRIGESE
jgi:hypothetical protein